MILNLSSLAFNASIEGGGGTPAWGTELGQGEGYRFSFENMDDILRGMVYKSVPDITKVGCPLGKGGSQRDSYEFSLASLFDKVFVNKRPVEGGKFLLLIVKKIKGDNHVGRRTLKYGLNMTYNGERINEKCFQKIEEVLGISKDSAWFIDEINVINQDELHFVAYVLGESPITYSTIIDRKKAFISKRPKNGNVEIEGRMAIGDSHPLPPFPLQQIFYGAPGTGKSHTIKEEVEGRGELFFRTTFHPDSDYATFVGAYKPVKEKGRVYGAQGPLKEGDAYIEEDRIGYRFVPQAFTRAYVAAWNTEKPVFLVIEEINRGNCAQIFGDLFQLLDRKNGYSEYPIDADEALSMYLQESLKASQRSDIPDIVRRGEKLQLPPNLYLWATMNTSDQSLFPIDSAFKRRWEWKYFPIKPCPEKHYEIVVGEHQYDWWGVIKKINSVIGEATHSEDKQLGYFFVTPKDDVITAEMLVGKVFFYLWNDVFKHYGFDHSIFSKGNGETYSFADFFQETGEIEIQSVVAFLEHIDQVVDNMHPFCLDTSATGVNEA